MIPNAQIKIPAVLCEEVKKTYHTDGGETFALRGANLEVKEGELFMLIGPSGCGKTTLISIIAGILDEDSGRCEIFGTSFKHLKPKERALVRSKTIGFVFQSFNLIPTLSVRENVAIPLLIQTYEREEALEKAKKTLIKVGLEKYADVFPKNLSGGQQQRVAIARSLIHQPKIIVCDEPTSALDGVTGHQVMEVFKSVANETTLLVVTHDPRIYAFADRIAVMNDGLVTKVLNSAEEL
jgi:putative ABC transport system ATP-binding protein